MPTRNPAERPGRADDSLRIRRPGLRISYSRHFIEHEPNRHSFDRPAASRDHLHRDRIRHPASGRRPLAVTAQKGQRGRHRVDVHRELGDHVIKRSGKDRASDCGAGHIPGRVHRRHCWVGRPPPCSEPQDPLPASVGDICHRLGSLTFRHPEQRVAHDPHFCRLLPHQEQRLRDLASYHYGDRGGSSATRYYGSRAIHRCDNRVRRTPDRRYAHQGIAVRVGRRYRQVDRVTHRRCGVYSRGDSYPAHCGHTADRYRVRRELRLHRMRVR
jgi:hypothetical protein